MNIQQLVSSWGSFDLRNKQGIFAFGEILNGETDIANIISDTGVMAADTSGVGVDRFGSAGAGYGTDKGVIAFGADGTNTLYFIDRNNRTLVSNTGVLGSEITTVATTRTYVAAAGYGRTKAIFGYGRIDNGSGVLLAVDVRSMTNLVSNTGVVAADVAGLTARASLAAATFAIDRAIFGYGVTGSAAVTTTNLVSNTGVLEASVTSVGTARSGLGAAGYGGDLALFGYGGGLSVTNKVSNTGVVAANTTGVGTARSSVTGVGFSTDRAIFGFGLTGGTNYRSLTNLVSNTGVVSDDTATVGTPRRSVGSASFG